MHFYDTGFNEESEIQNYLRYIRKSEFKTAISLEELRAEMMTSMSPIGNELRTKSKYSCLRILA